MQDVDLTAKIDEALSVLISDVVHAALNMTQKVNFEAPIIEKTTVFLNGTELDKKGQDVYYEDIFQLSVIDELAQYIIEHPLFKRISQQSYQPILKIVRQILEETDFNKIEACRIEINTAMIDSELYVSEITLDWS